MIRTTAQIDRGMVQHFLFPQDVLIKLHKPDTEYEVVWSEASRIMSWRFTTIQAARTTYWVLAKIGSHNGTPCLTCTTELKRGFALQNNYSGSGDFHDGDAVCTVSPDGTAKLIRCLKCGTCGHSETGDIV